jgi:hypothetical protein
MFKLWSCTVNVGGLCALVVVVSCVTLSSLAHTGGLVHILNMWLMITNTSGNKHYFANCLYVLQSTSALGTPVARKWDTGVRDSEIFQILMAVLLRLKPAGT